MSPRRGSVLGPADWGGDELTAAQRGLAEAQRVHAAATDARALAVYRARRRGATLTAIGKLLGMHHKNVIALERRGAGLAAECEEFGCHPDGAE